MIQRVKANQKIEREKLKANQKKIWKKEKNVPLKRETGDQRKDPGDR